MLPMERPRPRAAILKVPSFVEVKVNMSSIHLVCGEKGGVGKSVVARLIAQYCIDRAVLFAAFDGDRSHGALLRFYNEFSSSIDIDQYESADEIVNAALDSEQVVLVDLGAQSNKALQKWISDDGLVELCQEEHVPLVFWHVMDDGKDSVDLLEQLLDRYEDAVDYVVVKNKGRGKRFSIFEHSKAKEKALAMKARIMELAELYPGTMNRIDEINCSFWAAANNKDPQAGPCLRLLERRRVKIWLEKCYRKLDETGYFAIEPETPALAQVVEIQ
jgi:hypothetical protein